MISETANTPIATCYLLIKERIAQALKGSPRGGGALRIIAVSKSRSIANIEELYQGGQREFAENYENELQSKALQFAGRGITWIFIGRLQTNKIKRIVEFADEIQSVASLRQLTFIDRYAQEFGKQNYPIYLEVNAGDEASKGGFRFDELSSMASLVADRFPGLSLQGIMAIPPFFTAEQQQAQQKLYCRLRKAADGIGHGKLSLGMSSDFEAAIAAGSDCLRIGTALFQGR